MANSGGGDCPHISPLLLPISVQLLKKWPFCEMYIPSPRAEAELSAELVPAEEVTR